MDLSGVLAPIPTPFDEHGDISLERLRAALVRWLATPLTGFVVLGSNGEAVFLDDEESDRVVAAARDVVPNSRTFIVGTGRESTRGTTAATRRAAALGADAVLVRTPGFFKTQMTTEAFVRHYTAIADAAPVPVLLYNFTAVTGVTLPVDAVSQLARHPNIVGMKESGGDILRITDLTALASPQFAVMAGSPATFHTAVRLGAAGGILALGAVLPVACARLYDLTKAGRQDEARALEQQLLPIAQLLGSTYGVPGLKTALALVGCDVGSPRLPLMRLDDSAALALAEALAPFEEVHRQVVRRSS